MRTARLSVFELLVGHRCAETPSGSAFGRCVARPLVRIVDAIAGQPEHQPDCLVVAEALLAGEGAPGVETERDSDSGALEHAVTAPARTLALDCQATLLSAMGEPADIANRSRARNGARYALLQAERPLAKTLEMTTATSFRSTSASVVAPPEKHKAPFPAPRA